MVLERADRRLLDEQDVAAAFGQPVIARIPARRAPGERERRRVEAFDALAVKLRSEPQAAGRVIVMAAGAPARGDVAIRLAEALADLTPRVMLVEATSATKAASSPSRAG